MTTIDDYLQTLPEEQRATLQHIRLLVHQTAPGCTEVIRYGMPTLQYKGQSIIHFAAFKHHLSLFGNVEVAADELTDFERSKKGTVQFTADHPLPDTAIQRIVRAAVASIDQ